MIVASFIGTFSLASSPVLQLPPQVLALAHTVLKETSVIEGSFFKDLSTMSKEAFAGVQAQFYFAVNYFSRPMLALIARLPLHEERINILQNVLEEHGNFSPEHYHTTTFKQFLTSIGVSVQNLATLEPLPVVNMFNYTLMSLCFNADPSIAIACLGIIEYAFSDISALIAKKVIKRGWVTRENLAHYNLHAGLDKEHAEDFFKIIEPYMHTPDEESKIREGLRLGAYIFNRLYEDLYHEHRHKIAGQLDDYSLPAIYEYFENKEDL